jgi:hypothetical protein
MRQNPLLPRDHIFSLQKPYFYTFLEKFVDTKDNENKMAGKGQITSKRASS